MKSAIYIIGALTSLACALLLLRAYFGSRQRLLLWSGLCFVGLTIMNVLEFLDIVIWPVQVDLFPWRLLTGAISMIVLLYGLIWECK